MVHLAIVFRPLYGPDLGGGGVRTNVDSVLAIPPIEFSRKRTDQVLYLLLLAIVKIAPLPLPLNCRGSNSLVQ